MPGRVLVIDASPRMRGLFTEILALDKHSVRTATNPTEAREVANPDDSVRPFDPHIVFVDAALAPQENDSEPDIAVFGETLRTEWPESEIVLLVDASRPELKTKLQRGRLRHFSRPFQIDDLLHLVDGLLSRRKVTGR